MPFYYPIKYMKTGERKRTIAGLKRLRRQLLNEMPVKSREETIVLGTWNIRNFDDNRFVNGTRTKEDMLYLAEIISRFDILAVQEICEDLGPLDALMRLLGPTYDYILTDKTEGKSGNDERLGFIFDRAKLQFKGIAGELVLPDNMQITADGKKLQFSRTPFMCMFQSGWFKFAFSTVHIYFGSSSGKKLQRRRDEIVQVAKFLKKRAKIDPINHILVGDFNIPKPGDPTFNALVDNGFDVFQNDKGSNKDQTKFYDQISYLSQDMQVCPSESDKATGVLQFFDSIFREEDFKDHRSRVIEAQREKIVNAQEKIAVLEGKISRSNSANAKANYRKKIATHQKSITGFEANIIDDQKLKDYYMDDWRTFHASDHLPLWVELKINFSDRYLEGLIAAR